MWCNIKQNFEYDVIVAGGGPSGCAAATASARQGARTLLLEATYTLGGMGTSGLVTCFAPFGDGEKQISCGIAKEISFQSNSAAYNTEPDAIGWVYSSPEDLKRIYDRLVLNSGADICFGATVCDVKTDGNKVTALLVADKSGLTAYYAKAFIDCTGDGDVAAKAGAAFHLGDEAGTLQPATLCFVLTGVHTENFPLDTLNGAHPNSPIHKILALGDKYPLITDTHFCFDQLASGTISFNAGHIWESNSTDPIQISRSIVKGRELAQQFRDALAEVEPETFGDAYLVATAPLLGIRESRRIVGEYTLTLQDYIDRKSFPDEIARNCYYIDIHGAASDHEERPYHAGESHGIPFRCLIPKGYSNLLIAGRAISCSRIVMGSTRVMPNCLTTGEAAGVAAALVVQKEIPLSALDTDELRSILRKNGAYLP